MCLNVVDTTYHPCCTEIRRGFKVFRVNNDGSLNNLYYPSKSSFKVGQTLIDKHKKYNNLKYPNGFHIYSTLKDTKREYELFMEIIHNERAHRPKHFRIFEVLYTNIVAEGYQGLNKCDVAQRMTTIQEVKNVKRNHN